MLANETLHELIGASVDELLAPEKLDECPDYCVYVSGSLVEGLGNRSSDIDLFVVERGNASNRAEQVDCTRTSVHHLGHRRVDYQFWTERAVEQLASIANHHEPDAPAKLSLTQQEFIHRMRIGAPLTHMAMFRRLHNHFDFNVFASCLADWATEDVENALEDLYGMYDSDDLDTAVLRARDAVGRAVDVYRYRLGDTNPKAKWRARILRTLPEHELKETVSAGFWRYQFPNDPRRNDSVCRSYIRACIEYANEIIEWSQT